MATLKPAIDSIDTGSLDGDIELMIAASCSPHSQRLLQVMVSICSALPREPDLLEAFKTRFTEPRIARITEMLLRARRRGELGPDVDVAMAASLVPSLMLQRVLMTGQPAGRRLRRAGRGQRAAPGARTPRTTPLDHRHGRHPHD